MWENEELNGMDKAGESGTEQSAQQSAGSNYVNNGQPMSYGSAGQQTGYTQPGGGYAPQGQQTGYGQQNAWQNPYANRYNQAQGTGQYRNTGYQYTSTQFGGYPVDPGAGKKKRKGGAGKKIGIGVAIAAAIALVVFGLYEVAQRVPLTAESGGSVAQIQEQQPSVERTVPQTPAAEEQPAAEEAPAAAEVPAAGDATNGTTQRIATISGISPVIATDVTQVVASSMPAIVAIDNNFTQTINYFGQRYTQEATGSGSGIIVGQSDDALLIATNYHVIEDADSLSVQFVDGEKADAQVRDTDPDMDLAVISVPLTGIGDSTKSSIVIATLGDSDSLVLGEPAIAIGNALGQGQSVTVGVVSAVNRKIELSDGSTGTFIQTDAAINPGNSGGALLNSAGEVIGINSNKFADTDVEGMGFAIPISEAQPIIDEMMNREIIADEDRGYLGISGTTVPYEYTGIEGVRVRAVSRGSGAEAAGLQEDDIIIRLNGENIKSMESLQNKLKYCRAGETVTLTILRRQNDRYVEVDVDVKLSDAESAGVNSNTQQEQQQSDGNYYYYGNEEGEDDGSYYGYGFPFNFPFFGGGSY